MSGLPRLLSVRAVSEATTVPKSTLYDLIAEGKLPAVRIGRAVRVDERDVLKWIESEKAK